MKISGDWLHHPASQAVCAALSGSGYQALFVGGCVRNSLIGAPVRDIDIATDALPDEVTRLAQEAGLKVIPTGIDHGTVTIVANGLPHEVTTFRRDLETDGRRAVVGFSSSVLQDAARRDFTMNALYATADGTLVDPLGGLPDLLARRVRFVGNAGQRITEDYLRILRFFRFHAWYGDDAAGIDADGLAACATHSAGIDTLSKERIGAEMRKLLSAPDPSPAVSAMNMSGVLCRILPGAEPQALPILVHFGNTHWLARLAIIGGEDAAVRLRLSKAETAKLGLIKSGLEGMQGPSELGYRLGVETATDVVLCRAALFEQSPPGDWPTDIARGAAARFPVAAADLMPAFQGPALGKRLRELEIRWIESDFTLSKTDLLV